MEGISILTHNVLADCHLHNFVKDKEAAIAQNSRCITASMMDELDASHDLPPQVHEKYSWTNRSKLLGCLPLSYFSDVQCFQEITDPALLPEQESYESESQNGANEADQDKVVTRWKRDLFEVLCPPIKTHEKGKPALIVFLKACCEQEFVLCIVNLHHPGKEAARKPKYIKDLWEKVKNSCQRIEESKKIKAKKIWCGDFNWVAHSRQTGGCTSELFAQGFKEVANDRQDPTFFAHAYGLWNQKIDHIFYRESDFEVKDYRVLGTDIHAALIGMNLPFLVGPEASRTGRCDAISDHLPVLCELSLK